MRGKCRICTRTFTKVGMPRHLKTHLKDDGESLLYHIMIDGLYQPEYWLHIEIKADATLKDLDLFLRDVWLECCGHLSAFEIDGVRYYYRADLTLYPGAKDMNVALKTVLKPRMDCYYVYDFGSSTELRLKVVGKRMGKEVNSVRILARNEQPLNVTCSCGNKARLICTECIDKKSGAFTYLCHTCAQDHEGDFQLPIVNSPRCGVCGYEGGKYDEE